MPSEKKPSVLMELWTWVLARQLCCQVNTFSLIDTIKPILTVIICVLMKTKIMAILFRNMFSWEMLMIYKIIYQTPACQIFLF